MNFRFIPKADTPEICSFFAEHWGDTFMVTQGKTHHLSELSAIVAEEGRQLAGLVTFTVTPEHCEVVSLDAVVPGQGIGTALLNQCLSQLLPHSNPIVLFTTNDNLNALNFYMKRGFRLHRVHHGAVALARKIKPSIPLLSEQGLPVEDEIELRYSGQSLC